MRNTLRLLTLIACASAMGAQTLPQMASQAPTGLETDWEMGSTLKEIAGQASRLAPALDKIDARSWVDQGASETYAEQLEAAKIQTRALTDGANGLVKNPEQLSSLLDVFFRMQAIDSMLLSVEEGIRRYGYKPDAQVLTQSQAEASVARERLQRYIVNLAAEREREFQAMDREAQRCRAAVTAPKTGKKKE
jgi:hypothetical protein